MTTLCDVCKMNGKDNEAKHELRITNLGSEQEKTDLCYNCAMLISGFMSRGKVPKW